MKKMFMGFATLALFLASCSQNQAFENPTAPDAIKFKNLNDRIHSRAANDNSSDYGVFAVLNNGTPAATNWFMNNQQVKGADNSYAPVKYWPTAGTVNFYAYAPYNSATLSLAGVTWNGGTPTFDVSYTVPVNGNEDLTFATPEVGKTAADIQVNLEFVHQLSKVDFKAVLEQRLVSEGFALTLNYVTLNVAFNKGEKIMSNPVAAWSNLTANPAGTITYTNGTSYMIMPQAADGVEVILNVSITHNGNDFLMNQNLKTIVLTNANLIEFTKGTQYVFNATVGNTATDGAGNPIFNVIVFNSTLAPWNTGGDIELTNP